MLYRRLFLAFMVSLLAACGGGGGGTPTPVSVPAPVIISQPTSRSVTAGQPVTFSVGVQDGAGVSYQWLRNGSDIAGAAGVSYTLPVAQASDSGSTWSVRVGNAGGTVTSGAATLTVTPAIVQVPLGVSLFAGSLDGPGNADGTGADARFDLPAGIAVDAAGNAYVPEYNNATVRKITPAGVVTTLAGVAQGRALFDGTGAAARFNFPRAITLHSDGFLYVIDAAITYGDPTPIRRVSLAGTVTTFDLGLPSLIKIASGKDGLLYVASGGAVYKFSPGGAPMLVAGSKDSNGYVDAAGPNARFGEIAGLAVDAQSVIYVADTWNKVIRRISPTGEVTTLAGVQGAFGFSDGTGAEARFRFPGNPVLDAAGNIWVSDVFVLRRITPAGLVTTPFGGGRVANYSKGVGALAFDSSGNLLFSAGDGIGNFDAAGNGSNLAGDLVTPNGAQTPVNAGAVRSLAVDPQGVVYAFGTTSKYLPSGEAVPRALLPGESPRDLTRVPTGSTVLLEPGGSFLVATARFPLTGFNVVSPAGGEIARISPSGNRTVLASWPGGGHEPYTPAALAVDSAGTIYFSDFFASALRKLAPDGTVTTLGAAPVSADFFGTRPGGLAMSPAGVLYMTGRSAVWKLDAQGNVVVVAGSPGNPDIVDGPGTLARFLNHPGPAVFDAAGNLYVADKNTIRKVSPDGMVTTIAGQVKARGNTTGALPGSFGVITALAVGADGLLYVTADNALLRIRLQ